MPIRDDQVMLLNVGCDMSGSSVFSGSMHLPMQEFQGSFYERAFLEKRVMIIRDPRDEPNRSRAEEAALQSGARSLLIAPLTYQGRFIGTLDIASPNPGEFGPQDLMLMNQVTPIFSLAVKRALDEIDHQIQCVIKQKCTAVGQSDGEGSCGATHPAGQDRRCLLPATGGERDPPLHRLPENAAIPFGAHIPNVKVTCPRLRHAGHLGTRDHPFAGSW